MDSAAWAIPAPLPGAAASACTPASTPLRSGADLGLPPAALPSSTSSRLSAVALTTCASLTRDASAAKVSAAADLHVGRQAITALLWHVCLGTRHLPHVSEARRLRVMSVSTHRKSQSTPDRLLWVPAQLAQRLCQQRRIGTEVQVDPTAHRCHSRQRHVRAALHHAQRCRQQHTRHLLVRGGRQQLTVRGQHGGALLRLGIYDMLHEGCQQRWPLSRELLRLAGQLPQHQPHRARRTCSASRKGNT